jgi:hypothetical protein
MAGCCFYIYKKKEYEKKGGNLSFNPIFLPNQMNCRGIAVMEKSLEVTDNSSKLEDENASSYSAQFQLDNLQPSKKGQRESVSLHVKVNTVSDHLYPCHEPTVDISSVLLISSRGTDSAFRGMCTVRPVMDFLERA